MMSRRRRWRRRRAAIRPGSVSFQSSGASPASSPMLKRLVPVAPSARSHGRPAAGSARRSDIGVCRACVRPRRRPTSRRGQRPPAPGLGPGAIEPVRQHDVGDLHGGRGGHDGHRHRRGRRGEAGLVHVDDRDRRELGVGRIEEDHRRHGRHRVDEQVHADVQHRRQADRHGDLRSCAAANLQRRRHGLELGVQLLQRGGAVRWPTV